MAWTQEAILIYAGLFCLTRGAAKAEPANQPGLYLKPRPLLFD